MLPQRSLRPTRPDEQMSNESIIYLVAACSGVFGLAATFLTLYVLAGFLILGVVAGAAVIWFWDRITA